MIHFIIGGARSGKSRYAELQAEVLSSASDKQVVYLATGSAGDKEMASRIAHHQQTRPKHWGLIEESYLISKQLKEHNQPDKILLIDCLTLWISNWLCKEDCGAWLEEKQSMLQQLQQFNGDVLLVSNEVGSGIVPMGELSRNFIDESGRLNQKIASIAQRVTLVVAGLPLALKPAR